MLNQVHEKIKIGNHGGVLGMDACFLDMLQGSSYVGILIFDKFIDEDSVF
jgi:hypothetical protein